MIYAMYHACQQAAQPLNLWSKLVGTVAGLDFFPLNRSYLNRHVRAGAEFVERLTRRYENPGFQLDHTLVNTKQARELHLDGIVPVREEVVLSKPFFDLVHFKRAGQHSDPAVLMVAPMAGHYASLMRFTIQEFLPDHEVYVTDWKNARDVPLSDGDFGCDDFVEYIIDALRIIGPKNHLLSACQPCPWVLTAAAVMAMEDDPAQPTSMTLMAGPVDPRINTEKLPVFFRYAPKLSPALLDKLVIDRVPSAFPGRGRRVYAGFRNLAMFMSSNVGLHVKKHLRYYLNLVNANEPQAQDHRFFYDNYMATMDGTATFFHDTIKRIFYECHLPEGKMEYRGRRVDTGAIRQTALLTVEGANDEFCPPGQTLAAHDICPNIPKNRRGHHLQKGVGHYGVFNGSKFKAHVAPLIKKFMRAAETGRPVPARMS
jgi:poly(3-hydroxybutyrate) depolymerase